jgi:hypothetical protein
MDLERREAPTDVRWRKTPPRARRRGLAEAEGSLIPETRERWTAALTTPARGQHRMTAWLYGSLV